jgi:hypothetical protein
MKQAQCDSAGSKYKVVHRQDKHCFQCVRFFLRSLYLLKNVKIDFSECQDLTPEKCCVGVHTVSFCKITGVLGARGSVAG